MLPFFGRLSDRVGRRPLWLVSLIGLAVLATATFDGTAPPLNEAAIESTGWSLFPAAYMVGASLIGLLAWSFLRDRGNLLARHRGSRCPGADATDRGAAGVKLGIC